MRDLSQAEQLPTQFQHGGSPVLSGKPMAPFARSGDVSGYQIELYSGKIATSEIEPINRGLVDRLSDLPQAGWGTHAEALLVLNV